jgi:hypothetical protein
MTCQGASFSTEGGGEAEAVTCDGAVVAGGGLPSPWAHVARAAGEGSSSDAEAWRDETNELKQKRRLDGGVRI